jgi:hypothetical protein
VFFVQQSEVCPTLEIVVAIRATSRASQKYALQQHGALVAILRLTVSTHQTLAIIFYALFPVQNIRPTPCRSSSTPIHCSVQPVKIVSLTHPILQQTSKRHSFRSILLPLVHASARLNLASPYVCTHL